MTKIVAELGVIGLSASTDKKIELWDIEKNVSSATRVFMARTTPDGRRAVSGHHPLGQTM